MKNYLSRLGQRLKNLYLAVFWYLKHFFYKLFWGRSMNLPINSVTGSVDDTKITDVKVHGKLPNKYFTLMNNGKIEYIIYTAELHLWIEKSGITVTESEEYDENLKLNEVSNVPKIYGDYIEIESIFLNISKLAQKIESKKTSGLRI